jgi:hypothetical protein
MQREGAVLGKLTAAHVVQQGSHRYNVDFHILWSSGFPSVISTMISSQPVFLCVLAWILATTTVVAIPREPTGNQRNATLWHKVDGPRSRVRSLLERQGGYANAC